MVDQVILSISGKKGSGKNTCANFIVGLHLRALGIIKGDFKMNSEGQLLVPDIFGDKDYEGIFDIMRGTPEMDEFLRRNVDPYLKVYSFADLLKQEVCMKILGLTYEQCYGTDEQKNSLTLLKWEDMPGVIVDDEFYYQNSEWFDNTDFINHEPGFMTAREVMQYVGTNIFRKMLGNVWVDATIRRIKDEGATTALITDCRFPNEVFGSQEAGGKVIRLTRNPHNDQHDSETALDADRFDWSKFDAVIDNSSQTIDQQNKALYDLLKQWNLLPIELEL